MSYLRLCTLQIFEDNLCHIFYNESIAILFDPADPETVFLCLQKKIDRDFLQAKEIRDLEDLENRRKIHCVYTTHKHADHSAGNTFMMQHCPNVLIGESFCDTSKKPAHTRIFEEGKLTDNVLDSLGFHIEAIYTPCHTRDSYCFYIDNNGIKYLVTGDTFFYLGFGKFFEGNSEEMQVNVQKIRNLIAKDTLFLYGHDYSRDNIAFVEKNYWAVAENIKSKRFLMFSEEIEFSPVFNAQRISCTIPESVVLQEIRDKKDVFSRQKAFK